MTVIYVSGQTDACLLLPTEILIAVDYLRIYSINSETQNMCRCAVWTFNVCISQNQKSLFSHILTQLSFV